MKLRSLSLLSLTLAGLSAAALSAQTTPIADRHQWISADTQTDDTPRMVPRAPAKPGAVTVLKGGQLFDAKTLKTQSAELVIQGDRILSIVAPGRQQWPADAQIIDVTGKFVMPGLIDMHVHVTYPDARTRWAARGYPGHGRILPPPGARNPAFNASVCLDLAGWGGTYED